jgi:hypothetical protein
MSFVVKVSVISTLGSMMAATHALLTCPIPARFPALSTSWQQEPDGPGMN